MATLRNEALRDKYPGMSDSEILRQERLRSDYELGQIRKRIDGHLPQSAHCLCDGCRQQRRRDK